MRPFEKHVFVCVSGKTCPRQGSQDVIDVLRVRTKEAGLHTHIRINKAGCMAQCGHGPMVVVYPEGVWYSSVTADDATAIFEEHLVGGTPVERLRYEAGGINICPLGEEPIPPAPLDEQTI